MSVGPADVRVPVPPDVGGRVRAWVGAFRLKFLPQGVLPVVLGSLVAWVERGRFDPVVFVLALAGSACVQIGLTMLNDTLDFVYGADRRPTGEKNPFSGGSGVLADGALRPAETLTVVALFYLVAAAIGGTLTWRAGWGVLLVALVGLFLSVFYSVKPLRLAYRGVGELAMLVGYGPTITLGAAYAQTGEFSRTAGLAGLVPGLLMWAMILVNEIPDYREDLRARKLNLTVRLGPARVRWLYALSLMGIYAFVVGGAAARAFPPQVLLALGSLPFAVRSFRVALRHYLQPRAMAPANRDMVLTYSTTMILYSFGFWLSRVQG